MNPRLRMLLWEQCRLIVPAFAGLYAFFAVGLFGSHYLASNQIIWWGTYESLTVILPLFPSIAFMGILLVRRNSEGRITLTFDTRYFLLPIRTFEVVAFVLGMRLASLLIFTSFILLTGKYVSPEMFYFRIQIVVLVIFSWLQIYAWSYVSLKPHLIFISVILLYALFDFLSLGIFLWDGILNDLHIFFVYASPPLLILCFYSIHRQRTENIASLQLLDYPKKWFTSKKTVTLPPFKSQLEAQFWYETRNMGKMLFAIAGLAVLLFFSLSLFLSPILYELDLFDYFSDSIQLSLTLLFPVVIVAIATFIIGSIVLQKDYCRYTFRLPVSHGTFALAKTMACAKMLSLLSIVLLVFLSLLSMADVTGFLMLVDAYQAHEIDLIYILALVVRPTLFFSCVSWLILWWRTRILWLYLSPVLLFLFFPNNTIDPGLNTAPYFLFLLALYVLTVLTISIRRIKANQLYSTSQTRGLLTCLISVCSAGFLCMLCISHHPGKALFLATFLALLFIPVLTLPSELKRQRAE